MAQIDQLQMLPVGTVLDRRYRIVRYLGSGGFGNTYVAEDTRLGVELAVKEFFLRNHCMRDTQTHTKVITVTEHEMVGRYRTKFGKEAKIICLLKHPGIVHVSDVFEENDTVYYVMDYLKGSSLADMVKYHGHLGESEALRYIRKVAEALRYIHKQNVNHLDLKPANIMVRETDDEPIIIDFGVSKQYDDNKKETSTTPPGISVGYSPLEQYRPGGVKEFSPQSDIYALGATLYKILTGTTPPSASDVNEDGLPPFPKYVSKTTADAIEKAMEPLRKKRLATVDEFLQLLPRETDNEATIIPPLLGGIGETTIRFVHIPPSPQPVSPSRNAPTREQILCNLLNNMVEVKGGTFMMGEKYSFLGGIGTDNKAHQVTLSSFAISRTLVTQREWQAIMGNNPSHFKGDDLPVDNVSWMDCQDFISRLNELTKNLRLVGQDFHLPTEAEWEFAARGGVKSKGWRYSGSDNLDEVAWYDANSYNKPHPVAHKKANELGLYDMSGNVWEWCQDWYNGSYYSNSLSTNPCNNTEGSGRVSRGGSWYNYAWRCCVTHRYYWDPDCRFNDLGLRLAR